MIKEEIKNLLKDGLKEINLSNYPFAYQIMNNMEINNLKDLAFYCIRNLNPIRDSFGLTYKTNNTLLILYSAENKLRVGFHYEYVKDLDQYKHSVENTFELTKEELTEYEFTRVCAKNDLFDAGLKIFKQDVSD